MISSPVFGCDSHMLLPLSLSGSIFIIIVVLDGYLNQRNTNLTFDGGGTVKTLMIVVCPYSGGYWEVGGVMYIHLNSNFENVSISLYFSLFDRKHSLQFSFLSHPYFMLKESMYTSFLFLKGLTSALAVFACTCGCATRLVPPPPVIFH